MQGCLPCMQQAPRPHLQHVVRLAALVGKESMRAVCRAGQAVVEQGWESSSLSMLPAAQSGTAGMHRICSALHQPCPAIP